MGAIVLTGDFNAARSSSRVKELEKRLVRAFTGKAIGGIDHVFTNCGEGSSGRILGKGEGLFPSSATTVLCSQVRLHCYCRSRCWHVPGWSCFWRVQNASQVETVSVRPKK